MAWVVDSVAEKQAGEEEEGETALLEITHRHTPSVVVARQFKEVSRSRVEGK